METDGNSFMTEMLVPIVMSLPAKPNLTEHKMNPYYIVKRSEKVLKCSALFMISLINEMLIRIS